MSPLPAERAVHLDIEPDAVFGQLHAPAGQPLTTAVLIVPPWGWEAVASHRSLRAWAQHLARAGHVTLRVDLPASGDSGGLPSDPARLEAWAGAIAAAAEWLRADSGCARIATLGLGLGGLLAGRALADGARIEDLVLWAAPTRGRAFVREQRAFSKLQTSRMTLSDDAEPSMPRDGWLEAGGFVLSAETIAALEQVDLRSLGAGELQRALLLQRDGAGVDARLQAQLEQTGVDVTTGSGDGWEAMVAHPERPSAPEEVFAHVTSWLAQATGPAAPDPSAPPQAAAAPGVRAPATYDGIVLEVGGASVRESALTVPRPSGRLVGVLSEPVDEPAADLCAVFLNAGAVRRIGPNRMWVEAARRCAARGVPALRIDLEAIGDADGDGTRYRDARKFYVPGLVDQVGDVLDALQQRGLSERCLLLGLCSGGYWSFQTAVRDPRVSVAVLLNSGALVWDDDLFMRRDARRIARLRESGWWRKILRGDVPLARMRTIARSYLTAAVGRRLRGGSGPVPNRSSVETSIDSGLDRLRETATRLVLAFSGDESLHDELERDGILGRLERWPDVELVGLPGRDHTLRPIACQRAVHELIDRQIGRELDRVGARRNGRPEAARAAHRP